MSDLAASLLVLIPAYRERAGIRRVVTEVAQTCPNVLVIDDGSGDGTDHEAEAAGAIVLRQTSNQGKGAALARGFAYAQEHGYSAVITMDADGQHSPEDLPNFIRCFREEEADVIVGNRMADTSVMPWNRKLTNWYMSWLLSRAAGQMIPDSQNGYRLYRTEVLRQVSTESTGFAAESEILLRMARSGLVIRSVPTRTIYGDEQSKINPIPDTIRFFRMLKKFKKESKE